MSLLDAILAPAALTTLFQPIMAFAPDGSRRLHGYEALTRGPRGTHASRADVLFEYVRLKRAEAAVDRVCVLGALRAARGLPSCPRLSLNVHAATLGSDPGFVKSLVLTALDLGYCPDQLVVELVEQSSRWNTVAFGRAISALRTSGVRIAIDDLGFGHSNLQMLLEVRPEFVKIDRYFVNGCATDGARRAVLEAIQTMSASINCTVVAEGVEQADDLAVVRSLGISLVQGFLFSPPRAAADLSDDSLNSIAPTERALLLA